ncbi:uncharacterized protein LOC131671220 isoform X2 [Phymastichus coffea]|uniref:uncharacterized protein LOC131671220 isoform X2 n=1 Tax=Phymastichus coffea TaxID=108790 RepID=UPI00273ABFE3|nr:uncharacterized protein LOC131671220 isoform X2 [Phymastichus coffea]
MPTAVGNCDPERLSEIKTILRALLISNGKLDVTLPRLNGMFREEEGENIPFREFNYSSLQEFLRSMPDVMILRYNRDHQLCAYHVDTEESAHISSLVSRQKKPQKKAAKFNVSYKPRGNSHGNYYSNYSRPAHSSTTSTLNSLRLVLEELRKAPKHFSYDMGIRKSDILQKLKEKPGRSSINNLHTLSTKLKELSQYFVVDDDFVYFKEDVFTNNINTGSHSAQKSTKYAYQNLQVRSAPRQKIEIVQQANEYRPVINQSTPQFNNVERPTQSSQMPFTSQQSDQTQQVTLTNVQQVNYANELINERMKFRLQKLIEKYPEGIWAADLPNIYYKEYNIDLNYNELGFNSITEFVSAVPEILSITDPDDTDAEPIPNKLSPTVCQKFIPEGMMGFDETVEHISVRSLDHEDYFEVNISEIFTPSFFWITLRKNKSKIKKLMDELGTFYQSQDLDRCRLPQVLIETGLNVACIYAKMWHRAIIKKVKPDGYAVVLFYDYGTVKTYSPNDLYYLHKKFSALPAQAIACGLYNIKTPYDNEWPIPSTNMFVNKVWGVPLIATVCEINEDNNTMMITLTDTNDSFDLHLNDWMIENGLAVHGKMENTPSSKYHVITSYGVPLDKLCMYDEDVLRKRDQEYEKSLTMKDQDKTHYIGNKYTESEKVDIKHADVYSNCNVDSSFDKSSILTLVQENINLTRQTNTITQAILSNMPINTQLESRSTSSFETTVKNNFENESYVVNNSCSEDIKKSSLDLSSNLNTMKNNCSEIINDSRADVFKTSSVYLNQSVCNSNRELSVSSSSLPSNYTQSTKHNSNEFSNHWPSNQSIFLHQDTLNFQSQSTQEINHQNQVNQEYDKFSISDGTPTYYNIKHEDNLQEKMQFKYTSNFANILIDKSKINNNLNVNDVKESDDGYQTGKFASSAQSSNISSNTSFQSKSSSIPAFIPIELSERCFRKIIHIFHLDNEGWIPVNEFIECFTNLKLERVMFKLLTIFNIRVDYKYLTRADNAQLFSQLDKSKIKAPRESNKKIKIDFILTLLPLKAMLHVLAKLEFVDQKVFKEASNLIKLQKQNAADVVFEKFNNKILYDALNLLIQYRQFRRLHTP